MNNGARWLDPYGWLLVLLLLLVGWLVLRPEAHTQETIGPTIDNEWSTIGTFGTLCAAAALFYVAWLFWPESVSLLP